MTAKKDCYWLDEFSLKNGAKLFYRKAKRSGTVLILFLKEGGAYYDPAGREGTAHLLEHLLYGRQKYLPGVRNELKWREYAFSNCFELNAATSMRSIKLKGKSDKDPAQLFSIMSRMLKGKGFSGKEIEREKKIVLAEMEAEERDMDIFRMNIVPDRILLGDHPLARMKGPIGNAESVGRIKKEDLDRHRKRFFISSNLAIIAVSDLSSKEVKKMAEKFFSLPEGEKIPELVSPANFPKPSRKAFRYSVSKTMGVKKRRDLPSRIVITAAMPTRYCEQGYELKFARKILREILFRKLRIEKNLVYGSDIVSSRMRDISIFGISVDVDDKKAFAAERIILEAVKNFGGYEKIFKTLKKREIEKLKDSNPKDKAVADSALDDLEKCGRIVALKEDITNTRRIVFSDIREFVKKWIEPRILSVIVSP